MKVAPNAFAHLVQSAVICFNYRPNEAKKFILAWIKSPATNETINIVLSVALARYVIKHWRLNINEYEEGDRTHMLKLCKTKLLEESKNFDESKLGQREEVEVITRTADKILNKFNNVPDGLTSLLPYEVLNFATENGKEKDQHVNKLRKLLNA